MTVPMSSRVVRISDVREGYISVPHGRLYFLDQGPKDATPVMLIMGLACQLTMWPDTLVQQLLSEGFRVIRFDNRDIGLSDPASRGIKASLPEVMVRRRLGLVSEVNYTLFDMVQDTVAVLDGLGIPKANVVGASMGGMISQLLAAIYPQRVASLCSIMSSTNENSIPLPRRDVLMILNGWGLPKGHEKEVALKRQEILWSKISSPRIAEPKDVLMARLAQNFERSYRPSGVLRQTQGVAATSGFRKMLGRVRCPTQILHGDVDPLVHVKGGIDSAKSIRGAKLHIYKGMAHDFPPSLVPSIGEKISHNIAEALTR